MCATLIAGSYLTFLLGVDVFGATHRSSLADAADVAREPVRRLVTALTWTLLLGLEAAQMLLCHLHPAAYIALSFSLVALLIQVCAVATARDRLKRSPPSETVEELLRQIAHGHRTALPLMLGVIAAEQWGATSGCGAIGALTTLETLAQWQNAGAAAAARELEAYENAELYQFLGIAGATLFAAVLWLAACPVAAAAAAAAAAVAASPFSSPRVARRQRPKRPLLLQREDQGDDLANPERGSLVGIAMMDAAAAAARAAAQWRPAADARRVLPSVRCARRTAAAAGLGVGRRPADGPAVLLQHHHRADAVGAAGVRARVNYSKNPSCPTAATEARDLSLDKRIDVGRARRAGAVGRRAELCRARRRRNMTARDAVLADAFNSLLEILSRHELDGEAAVADAQSRGAMPALARRQCRRRAARMPAAAATAGGFADSASEAEQLAEAAHEVAAIADERATSLTSYELGSELGLGRFSRVVRARERGGRPRGGDQARRRVAAARPRAGGQAAPAARRTVARTSSDCSASSRCPTAPRSSKSCWVAASSSTSFSATAR